MVTGIGLVAGLVGAAIVTRLMRGALFGIAPLDAVSFAAAPLALLPVAIVFGGIARAARGVNRSGRSAPM